jgi:hypothetical protein
MRRVSDAAPPAEGAEPAERAEDAEGGETACWAHLVCPECGAMVSEGHAAGCSSGPAASAAR